jgi:hypothetical protein
MSSGRVWQRLIFPVIALVFVGGYEAVLLDTYLGVRTVAYQVECSGGRHQSCRRTLRHADGRVEDVDISGVDPYFIDIPNGADVAVRDGPVGAYLDSTGAFLRRAVIAGLNALLLLGYLVRRHIGVEPDPVTPEAAPRE